jgi:CubicO group peptidase (beta-lactamase class C family)
MHPLKAFLLFAIAALVMAPPAGSPSDAIDSFLSARVATGDVPGVVAMVVDRQSTVYAGAFGQADVAGKRPMAKDSIFRIASMTKPVTSLAVMMLIEQQQLGLDDPLTKYLPHYGQMKVATAWRDDGTFDARPPKRPITVRDLLTHTSGIAYSFVDAHLAKLDDGKQKTWELPLVADPGERFEYGPSTMVLGEIVEKVSGMTLDAFFQRKIFEPLGMHDTGFTVPAGKGVRVVTIHTREADGSLKETPNRPTFTAPAHGDGGLFSTAADYARFLQVFLNRGRVGSTRLLNERTIDLMTTNQLGAITIGEQSSTDLSISRSFPIGAGKDTFGFGFQIEARPAVAGMRSAGSLSWGGLFNTHFWIDPSRGIAAVVLMQVLPYYDENAIDVLRGFERQVYRD